MCDLTIIPLSGIREPVSSLTHFIGVGIFGLAALLLLRRGRGDRLRMASLGVMVYACLQMLVVSSIYHMLWPGPSRELMLRVDVAGIFFVIAGSITPVHTILFSGPERWAPLAVAWTTATGGMILRMVYFDQLPPGVGTAIFLVFGWGGAVTAFVLWRRYGWKFVCPAVLAGLSYTVGAVVLLLHRPTLIAGIVGPHEIWHLAVLAGLGLHWRFVFQFAGGTTAIASSPPLRVLPLQRQLAPIAVREQAEPLKKAV